MVRVYTAVHEGLKKVINNCQWILKKKKKPITVIHASSLDSLRIAGLFWKFGILNAILGLDDYLCQYKCYYSGSQQWTANVLRAHISINIQPKLCRGAVRLRPQMWDIQRKGSVVTQCHLSRTSLLWRKAHPSLSENISLSQLHITLKDPVLVVELHLILSIRNKFGPLSYFYVTM